MKKDYLVATRRLNDLMFHMTQIMPPTDWILGLREVLQIQYCCVSSEIAGEEMSELDYETIKDSIDECASEIDRILEKKEKNNYIFE